MRNTSRFALMLVLVVGLSTQLWGQDPIGRWAFDDNLLDSAGTVHGTFNTQAGGSLNYVAGKYGKAVALDSAFNQYVVLGDKDDLNFGADQDFSIAFWVITPGWENDAPMISNKDWDSGSNTGYVIAGEGDGEGSWQWNFRGVDADRVDYDPPGPILSDSVWHHICVTHDRDGVATFYFDGLPRDVADISGSGSIDSGLPTVVGTDGAEGTVWQYWFNGAIDELRIYDRVITGDEVIDLADVDFVPQLLSHFTFDETLEDMVGDAHGTYNGFKLLYTDGIFGKALNLDGMNDFVTLGDTLKLRFEEDDDFTVSLWVRTRGWSGDPVIVGNKDWGSGSNVGWLVAASGASKGSWQWNFRGDGGDRLDYDPDGVEQPIADGDWHHILITHDRDSVAIYYYDGMPVDTLDIRTSNGSLFAGYPVNVGQDGTGEYGDYFKGDVDELRFYNYVIDAAEINKLTERPAPMPKMLAHYTFDETMHNAAGSDSAIFYNQFGPVASPKFVEGRYGQAIDLDQSQVRFNYITLGTANDYNFGFRNDFTVAIWVKTTGWDGDAPLITNKDWDSGNNVGWLVAGEGGGEGGWQYNYNTSESSDDIDFDPEGLTMSDGKWHHIAVTTDRDGYATYYYDGRMIGMDDISERLGSVDAGFPVTIGNDGPHTYGDFFDGAVDEVRIYNYALTYAEVVGLAETPVIASVSDVPNDQGGFVYVRFFPALMDHAKQSGHTYYIQRHDEKLGWVSVGSAPATRDTMYTVLAATMVDSTAEGTGMTDFRLVTTTPQGTYISQTVAGYSVDNIAPAVPQDLIATPGMEDVALSWRANGDNDLNYYAIYRSTEAGFDPAAMEGPTYTTTEVDFSDNDVSTGETYYYRIAAVDFAGNSSAASSEVAAVFTILAGEGGVPTVFRLRQNYPNPFNPGTIIRYDLPQQSRVSIEVFNIKGQKVATLLNGVKPAGFHSIEWNASNFATGLYFYRITAGDFTSIKKMMLVK
jgi:hypothetical protein